MADFTYTYVTENGTTESGTIKAATEEEATKDLTDRKILILNLQQVVGKKNRSVFSMKKVKLVDKVIFFDHLAQMMKAGLNLLETLDALKDDTENKYFRKVIEDIKYGVETGNTLSSGMEKYPAIFNHLMIKVIEVGEISGTLVDSANQLAMQVKKDFELRAKVKGALIYPEILTAIMVIAGGGLLIFVIPQLSLFFKQSNLQLPLTTQILISLSDFLRNDYLVVIVLLVGGIVAFKRLKKSRSFTLIFDRLLLKAPIIGPISKKLNVTIFARTLASLLKSAIPFGKALEIVSDSVTNSVYQKAIRECKNRVEKGEPLSIVMHDYPNLFPNLAIRMVAVGDKTGTTPDMLANTAEFYQKQIDDTLGNISTIIEPVMLFIMGGATLFIALSVITPIYQLTSGAAGG